ncbi:PD-(D/E)XK nuclease family protein [Gemella sp. Musashino-2025]
MQLDLLISPSGFGKTDFILNDIDKNRKNSKIIVLTPEQNSYNFEKLLCEKFGGTFNIDVMNFSSLTKKLYKKLGIDTSNSLGDDIKPFYFYKAALNLKNSDNFLVRRILQDSSFIEVVQDIIRELKQYRITIKRLEDYLENNKNPEEAHKNKLEAVLEIYLEYTKLVKKSFLMDKEDYIDEFLLYSKYLDLSNYIFYIDAFYNFSLQEYSYIEKLIQLSKRVVFSVIADANRYFNVDLKQVAEGYEIENIKYNKFYLADLHGDNKYKLDMFRKSHEVVANLNEILRKNSNIDFNIIAMVKNKNINTLYFKIKEDTVINSKIINTHIGRFKGVSNEYLANNYYKAFKSLKESDDSIKIIRAKNKELEVKQVAREILKLKSEKNILENDIAILYRDNTYENYINIFNDYGLVIHLDKDENVSHHRLIKFLTLSLNFDPKNFKDSIIKILKTRLTNIEKIYKQKMLSVILFNDSKLSKSEFDKRVKLLDKEKISGVIIKDISIYDIDNILTRKLITKLEDLKIDYFTEPVFDFSTEQLFVLAEALTELTEKIQAIINEKNKKITAYIKQIEQLFSYCDIKMTLDKEDGEYDNIEELKIDSIDRQVYKKTLTLLDNINNNFKNEVLSYNKFVDLLTIGLSKIKYRSIPEINNSIIMSTMDLAKVENKKVVFVIGFNKEVLPKSKKSGLLDDNDKEYFITKELYISPTVKASLIDEEFVAYIALTRAKECTYISYSSIDKSFKESFASTYLNVVKSMLVNISEKETDKILEFNINNYSYYLENINEIYTAQEFNYLFVKIYRRYQEVKGSETKEVSLLSQLITFFINNYIGLREQETKIETEVYSELNDRIYFSNNNVVRNYLPMIIKDYKFKLSEENISKFLELHGDKFSNFSISKISDFEKNPYLFFIKRMLGVKEDSKVELDNLVTGRFFHAVLADEKIINFIKNSANKVDLEYLEDMEIIELFNIQEKIESVVYNSTNKDILETLQFIKILNTYSYNLKILIRRLVLAVAIEIKYVALTKYEPKFLEKKFELVISEDKISCKELETGNVITKKLERIYNVPTLKFTGTIDRIDVLNKNILVIDYKSSETNFKLDMLELGFVSQVLTYALASEMLLNKKSDDIFGVFYREIAKIGKELSKFRLRGIANSDLVNLSEFKEITSDIMYLRITKKGIHGSDIHKAYNSRELSIITAKNLDNIMVALEKIYTFEYVLDDYEVSDNYMSEKQTLYNYSSNTDTRLEYKHKVDISKKELRKKILERK